MPPPVKNGILTIPLYHGTSSLNLCSIEEYGLGGHDIISALDVVSYIKKLLNLGDKLFKDEPDWNVFSIASQPFADQGIIGGMNFRHGHTYLTPSKATARLYAVQNHCGSEIINQAKLLSDKITSKRSCRMKIIQKQYQEIVHLLKKNGIPTIIELPYIPVIMLKSELGGSPKKPIRNIKKAMSASNNQKSYSISHAPCNFQLDGVVSYSLLKHYNA